MRKGRRADTTVRLHVTSLRTKPRSQLICRRSCPWEGVETGLLPGWPALWPLLVPSVFGLIWGSCVPADCPPPSSGPQDPRPGPSLLPANNLLVSVFLSGVFFFLVVKSVAYGMDSRPPMAIFELLDYIVNEVSSARLPRSRCLLLVRLSYIGKPGRCSHSGASRAPVAILVGHQVHAYPRYRVFYCKCH